MLKQEWLLLQQQYEGYESWSLILKLVALIVALVSALLGLRLGFAELLLVLLWGQETIWKTFQARLGTRILQLEAGLKNDLSLPACQLHSEWQTQRPGTVGLVKAYLLSGMKPTVAYPYVVLMLALWVFT